MPPTVTTPAAPRYLEGWGAIAGFLSRRLGVDVSKDAARRSEDTAKLPVSRIQIGRRPRVRALPSELDRWCEERTQPGPPHPPRSP